MSAAPSIRAEPLDKLRASLVEAGAGSSVAHESARAQVQGAVRYVDDIPELQGTLHAAPVMSRVAHGKLHGLDVEAALRLPGVRGIVTARDIPGDPIFAAFGHDEPIFATETVQYVGNVLGIIVADDVMTARKAARLV